MSLRRGSNAVMAAKDSATAETAAGIAQSAVTARSDRTAAGTRCAGRSLGMATVATLVARRQRGKTLVMLMGRHAKAVWQRVWTSFETFRFRKLKRKRKRCKKDRMPLILAQAQLRHCLRTRQAKQLQIWVRPQRLSYTVRRLSSERQWNMLDRERHGQMRQPRDAGARKCSSNSGLQHASVQSSLVWTQT